MPARQDFYIADNVILGRDDPYRLLGWASPDIYGAHELRSYYAVKVYGSGHVICHNAVAYFHDGIDVSTHGTPETEEDRKAVAIDIYNNDIHVTGDDFIEADGGVHNIRVMRNRGVNAAHSGLSAQPVFGGPVYFIRNVLYNVPTRAEVHGQARRTGALPQHHHFREPEHADLLQRAFPQQPVPGHGCARPCHLGVSECDVVLDLRLRRLPPESGRGRSVHWIAPRKGVLRDYEVGSRDAQRFGTLAEMAAATGQETHGVEVDYDMFENVRPPNAATPHAVYHAASFDFRLKAGGKAVDAGVRLPNVNDDFAGQAPDLGAYEAGKPLPVYGPRRGPTRPFYQ